MSAPPRSLQTRKVRRADLSHGPPILAPQVELEAHKNRAPVRNAERTWSSRRFVWSEAEREGPFRLQWRRRPTPRQSGELNAPPRERRRPAR